MFFLLFFSLVFCFRVHRERTVVQLRNDLPNSETQKFISFRFIFCLFTSELVPVSSTVIPLDIYEAHNSGTIPYSPPLSAEYKIAYLQLMHKKSHKEEDPKVCKFEH